LAVSLRLCKKEPHFTALFLTRAFSGVRSLTGGGRGRILRGAGSLAAKIPFLATGSDASRKSRPQFGQTSPDPIDVFSGFFQI